MDKNKIVTLREYLEAMFKEMDYQDIVYWDRVEGATGAIDKLTLTDEVQDALLHEQISERHARSLLNITDPVKQVELLHKVINSRMTVRELDQEITINQVDSKNL